MSRLFTLIAPFTVVAFAVLGCERPATDPVTPTTTTDPAVRTTDPAISPDTRTTGDRIETGTRSAGESLERFGDNAAREGAELRDATGRTLENAGDRLQGASPNARVEEAQRGVGTAPVETK